MSTARLSHSCIKFFNRRLHSPSIEILGSYVSMSNRPNYEGASGSRAGGSGRRGGGGSGRGRRGGGRGEQRWWDPQWRAERLAQLAGPVENLDPNEWQTNLKQFKDSGQQELVVKRNFGRRGQHTLEEMAHHHGLYLKPCLQQGEITSFQQCSVARLPGRSR